MRRLTTAILTHAKGQANQIRASSQRAGAWPLGPLDATCGWCAAYTVHSMLDDSRMPSATQPLLAMRLGRGALQATQKGPAHRGPAAPLFKGGRGGGERIAQASGSDYAASYRLLGPDRSLEGNLQCTTPVLLQPAKGAARFCRPCARRAQRQITGRNTSPEPASDKPRCGKDLRPSVSGRDPSDTALNTRAAGPSRDGSLPSSHVLYPRASDHVCACFPVQCRVVAPLPGRRLSDRLLVFPAVHPCISDPQRDAAVYPVPW
jgi:hypothetical protein